MKIKNFTIYFFAVIGFVVIACSAAATTDDNNPDDNPPIVQSSIGKYQVSFSSANYKESSVVLHMVVLNTETGVSKTYGKGKKGDPWVEITPAAVTFTQ